MSVAGHRRPPDLRWTAEPPVWEQTAPLTLAKVRSSFDHTLSFTIGVEEELMLVDAETFDLAPAIDEVLPLVAGDRRFSHELRAAQIEIITPVWRTAAAGVRGRRSAQSEMLTPVCTTAAHAFRDRGHPRRHLIERVDGRYRLLACGTPPFSS